MKMINSIEDSYNNHLVIPSPPLSFNNKNQEHVILGQDSIISSCNKPLGREFVPQRNDVIVGKSLMFANHVGNLQFREMVGNILIQFPTSEQEEKEIREHIVDEVVKQVRELSPPGKFFKCCVNGSWVEVSEFLAKENAGRVMREVRSEQKARKTSAGSSTSSSTRRNNKRRMMEQQPKQQPIHRRRSMDSFDFVQTVMRSLPENHEEDSDPFEPVPIQQVFSANPFASRLVRRRSC